jgi:hypothetical protein
MSNCYLSRIRHMRFEEFRGLFICSSLPHPYSVTGVCTCVLWQSRLPAKTKLSESCPGERPVKDCQIEDEP